jgi:hypothetical protein
MTGSAEFGVLSWSAEFGVMAEDFKLSTSVDWLHDFSLIVAQSS